MKSLKNKSTKRSKVKRQRTVIKLQQSQSLKPAVAHTYNATAVTTAHQISKQQQHISIKQAVCRFSFCFNNLSRDLEVMFVKLLTLRERLLCVNFCLVFRCVLLFLFSFYLLHTSPRAFDAVALMYVCVMEAAFYVGMPTFA